MRTSSIVLPSVEHLSLVGPRFGRSSDVDTSDLIGIFSTLLQIVGICVHHFTCHCTSKTESPGEIIAVSTTVSLARLFTGGQTSCSQSVEEA